MKQKYIIRRDSDSLLTFVFARSVSVHITPLLCKTKVTPMQVTVMGLLVGVCGALFASLNSWYYHVLAAVLIETSHILDCVDGELARMTDRGNLFAAFCDPISDRFKDIAIICSAYFSALNVNMFGLAGEQIAILAILCTGFWLVYVYIVDAFLNPSRIKLGKSVKQRNIYLGLYDLFIYGSVILLLFDAFHYFIIYIMLVSLVGIFIQLVKLKSYTIN